MSPSNNISWQFSNNCTWLRGERRHVMINTRSWSSHAPHDVSIIIQSYNHILVSRGHCNTLQSPALTHLILLTIVPNFLSGQVEQFRLQYQPDILIWFISFYTAGFQSNQAETENIKLPGAIFLSISPTWMTDWVGFI